MRTDLLSNWRDGGTKEAIVAFVERVTGEDGSPAVPVADRLAVFDNDGTLWCEKPMSIQLDFILRRLAEMAEAQTELRERQPWKAAHERDFGWFGATMTEHYAGDDTNVRILAAGVLAAHTRRTTAARRRHAMRGDRAAYSTRPEVVVGLARGTYPRVGSAM